MSRKKVFNHIRGWGRRWGKEYLTMKEVREGIFNHEYSGGRSLGFFSSGADFFFRGGRNNFIRGIIAKVAKKV